MFAQHDCRRHYKHGFTRQGSRNMNNTQDVSVIKDASIGYTKYKDDLRIRQLMRLLVEGYVSSNAMYL